MVRKILTHRWRNVMKRVVREYLQLLAAFIIVVVAAAVVMFLFVQCLGLATK